MRTLPIGCDWGAMPRAIAECNAFATGITLVDKQLELRWEKLPPHLEGHIEYHLEDYRIHAARNPALYDRVVSIGMFEYVGRCPSKINFKAIRSLLKPGGRAVVHNIVKGITSPTSAWVERYRRIHSTHRRHGRFRAVYRSGCRNRTIFARRQKPRAGSSALA